MVDYLDDAAAPPLALTPDEGQSPDPFLSLTEDGTLGPLAFLNGDDRGVFVGNKPSLLPGDAGVQISRGNFSWGGALGQAANVTFAFRATAPSDMPSDTAGFSQFSAVQINATLLALAAWSDVANITFTRVDSGNGYSDNATMLFGNYSSGESGAAAFAYFPGNRATSSNAGDVWINSTIAANITPTPLLYGQHTLVHEIGHAIGLSHPADYNASEGVSITYAANATYAEDSRQYTVMSYFSETNTGASFTLTGAPRYASAPLLDDISAIQRLYGANMSTRTGDTVYGFNSNAGQPWFSATGATSAVIFCVWDAGGTDTLDFSGYSMGQVIDLRQASFSNVGGMIGNVSIAVGAVIENAIGGTGSDTIRGNAADNRLAGGGGFDNIDGGLGVDTVVFQGARSAYNITWQGRTGYITGVGNGETVTVTNVEFLAFTDQTIAATPTGGLVVTGDLTNNIMAGTALVDQMNGGGGADQLSGLDGNDRLDGGWGDDQIFGGAGDDYLIGGLGNDILDGGADVDTVDYSTTTSSVSVNLTTGLVTGGAGSDTVTAIEIVRGTAFDDTLIGDGANNTLYGLGGADTLRGMGGDDVLTAGAPGIGGGAPDIVKPASTVNNSISTAISIDGGFDILTRAGVANSTTTPHATIVATSHGGVEYYAFTVTAGAAAYFDIDDAAFDTTLRLFDASGTELAKNDDDRSDGGGELGYDAGLSYTFTTGGTYYIQVARWGENIGTTDFTSVAPAANATYTLNVSIPNHPVVPAISTGATIDGGDGNDSLYGGVASDYIVGGDGNDLIVGGSGNDLLVGGSGTDTFRYLAYSDSVNTATQPTDVIDDFQTGVDKLDFMFLPGTVSITNQGEFNLVTNIGSSQTLAIRVRGAISLSDILQAGYNPGQIITGTPQADNLIGSTGNDVIIGLGGGDALAGGGGRDIFQYDATSDSTPAAFDNLYDFEWGTDSIDLSRLTTSAISIIRAGAGNGTYLFANTPDGAFQLVAARGFINAADLIYSGAHGVYVVGSADSEILVGSTRADGIDGGAGADTITGGLGADALGGGAGADVFRYLTAADSNASGYDNLFDFQTGLDRLDLSGLGVSALSIIRQDGSTFLFGNTTSGAFQLVAAGRDINGSDVGGVPYDMPIYMIGSSGADTLIGGYHADPIFGGDDDDILIGGMGADALFGEGGADTFRYQTSFESSVSASDRIFGFVSGVDKIDLSAVHTGAADRYGIAYSDGGSFLFVDLGGDGSNEMLIQLANTTLQASDLIWGSIASSVENAALSLEENLGSEWISHDSLDGRFSAFLPGSEGDVRPTDWWL